MNKDQWISLVKTILTLAGSFLIGKHFMGVTIDNNYWGLVIGGLITAGSFVWSILDKSLVIEQLQATVRQVVVSIGGILIASGKLDSAKLDTYLGLITAILPLLYSILSKNKSAAIANGTIPVSQLNGVKPNSIITPTK